MKVPMKPTTKFLTKVLIELPLAIPIEFRRGARLHSVLPVSPVIM